MEVIASLCIVCPIFVQWLQQMPMAIPTSLEIPPCLFRKPKCRRGWVDGQGSKKGGTRSFVRAALLDAGGHLDLWGEELDDLILAG